MLLDEAVPVHFSERKDVYFKSILIFMIAVEVFLQFATKNHAVTLSLLPPPQWDGEENQKEKGKNSWVGMRTV